MRERHQNRVIARQQQEISELSTRFDRVDSDWRKEISRRESEWDFERKRLESQLSLSELERTTLEEVIARNRARVEKEAAIEVRAAENSRYGIEKPK